MFDIAIVLDEFNKSNEETTDSVASPNTTSNSTSSATESLITFSQLSVSSVGSNHSGTQESMESSCSIVDKIQSD